MTNRRYESDVKAFKRLVSAKHDFAAALEAAEWLRSNYQALHEGIAYRAIETGIVVSYARPFGSNNGLGPLPKNFQVVEDNDAQHVHDRLLFARNTQEAHNDILRRGRLITSADRVSDPLNIRIEITNDGRTFWDLATPALAIRELDRLIRMIRIQDERLKTAVAQSFNKMLKEKARCPGLYTLGIDFP